MQTKSLIERTLAFGFCPIYKFLFNSEIWSSELLFSLANVPLRGFTLPVLLWIDCGLAFYGFLNLHAYPFCFRIPVSFSSHVRRNFFFLIQFNIFFNLLKFLIIELNIEEVES